MGTRKEKHRKGRKNTLTLYFPDLTGPERYGDKSLHGTSWFMRWLLTFFIPCLLFILSRNLFLEIIGITMNSIFHLISSYNLSNEGSTFLMFFLKFILNAKETYIQHGRSKESTICYCIFCCSCVWYTPLLQRSWIRWKQCWEL